MNISEQFTISKNLTYLDSGATTQTPSVVLAAMDEYYKEYRANVHRGVYATSVRATEKYEGARASVANFINANPEEIIFTSGTTAGLNQLAYSLGPRLSHRDNVVLTRAEHHSNLVPWQQMAKHYGFEIRFINIDPTSYKLQAISYNNLIDENTKIVSLTYVSNVLGIINPIEEIIKIIRQKSPKAYTIIDGAQAMSHLPVDVQKLDCDFLAFSGHKMYGPTGIGVLYGKKIMLEEHLEPFLFGGEMVQGVSFEKAQWNSIPWRFEAGTPNIAGAVGLGSAVAFIQSIGWAEIQKHEQDLKNILVDGLQGAGARYIVPTKQNTIGLVSFVMEGIHPHDIADILSQDGICVRGGFHCAEPLHRYLGLNQGTARASLGIYNTKEDIDKLIEGIEKIKKIFAPSLQATS